MNKKSIDIREALRRHFPSQEYALAHEVAQATGYRANRHLDCIIMSLWPSRGLYLTGIEIKVNLYDWKKEKANPEKAEEIARYCDYFFIAAPVGLIPLEDIPEAWGLIEVDDKGKCHSKKPAVKTDAKPINREFLAAMLRASQRSITKDEMEEKLDRERKALHDRYDEMVKNKAEQLAFRGNEAAKNWNSLVAAIGEDPGSFYDNSELIAVVKAVKKSGVARAWSGLETLKKTLAEQSKIMNAVFKDMCLEEKTKK